MYSYKNHEQITIILLGKASQNKKFVENCGGKYISTSEDESTINVTVVKTHSKQFQIACINSEHENWHYLLCVNKEKVDIVINLDGWSKDCSYEWLLKKTLENCISIDFQHLHFKYNLTPLQCLEEIESCFAHGNTKALTILSAHLFDSNSLFSFCPKEVIFKICGEYSLVSPHLFFSPHQKNKQEDALTITGPAKMPAYYGR